MKNITTLYESLEQKIRYHWTFMQKGQHKTNLPLYSLKTLCKPRMYYTFE